MSVREKQVGELVEVQAIGIQLPRCDHLSDLSCVPEQLLHFLPFFINELHLGVKYQVALWLGSPLTRFCLKAEGLVWKMIFNILLSGTFRVLLVLRGDLVCRVGVCAFGGSGVCVSGRKLGFGVDF